MPCLRLGILGSLQFSADDTPLATFGSDKACALLLYLAVESDRPHRREELIGLLWADFPEETARHNLRQALFNIRRAIGDRTAQPPYLLITHDEIQFNSASDYTLDVVVFKTHLTACHAHQHPAKKICAECAAHLQQAVELYRGKFLQQFFIKDSAEFEEWALIQRESLHRSALEALAHLADYHEQRGDYEQACRYSSRQLELDPWREEAHRQMMRLLALSGERSAALRQYETCQRVLADELGVEPSFETRELLAQISRGELVSQQGDVSPTPPLALRPLPLPLTPFIGRKCELEDLQQLLADPQCRLISLVGPGGIGKTRLALQVASQQCKAFVHGTVFVPLASVGSTEGIVPAIAAALDLVFSGSSDPQLQIFRYLRDKQMLLVLDNVEHLLNGIELFTDILQHAPAVKLLCTSRESLHVQSEWVFEVVGLTVPENEQTEKFEDYGAVALFVQHAHRTRVGYSLTAEERIGVARICHLVEGMPLALELAATWVRTLSSREIADQIEQNLDFLATAMRDLPERHRAMRAVFDQSWRMLTAEEQGVLSKLSVFRGGFQRQASERVANAPLTMLSTLVSKSLVRRTGSGRYDLHELVRQFAATKLATDPTDQTATRDRHSDYYLTFVKQEENRLFSHRQKEALVELATEIANIRLALAWAIDLRQIARLSQISFALLRFYEFHGWYREGESIFREAADKLQSFQETDPLAERDRQITLLDMQTNQANFIRCLGKPNEAYAMHRRCTDLLRSLGDKTVLRYSLRFFGWAAIALGLLDEAKVYLRESLELSRIAECEYEVGMCNSHLGYIARAQGAYADAELYYKEALTIARRLGIPNLILSALTGLGFVCLWFNQFIQAREFADEALPLAQELGDRHYISVTLGLLGRAEEGLGETAKARALFEQSIALLQEIGNTLSLPGAYCRLGYLTLSMGDAREAKNIFRTALSIATKAQEKMSTLDALMGLATVYAQIGAGEFAMELVAFILRHPASHAKTKSLAEQLGAQLETQLTPEQIKVISLRTQAKTLERITQEILATPDLTPDVY
ncbi:MAG: tetratricopeptide repeat protein [Chloroflexi bacterium]|nr:tetratricopeptide repeat protein [Chloroflexota bacterium]